MRINGRMVHKDQAGVLVVYGMCICMDIWRGGGGLGVLRQPSPNGYSLVSRRRSRLTAFRAYFPPKGEVTVSPRHRFLPLYLEANLPSGSYTSGPVWFGLVWLPLRLCLASSSSDPDRHLQPNSGPARLRAICMTYCRYVSTFYL